MNKKFYTGCGFTLITLGIVLMVGVALVILGAYNGDQMAADENKAEWQEYNEWVAQVEATADTTEVDSIIESRPKPDIRQGGFATIFGSLMGIVLACVAAIPLIVGFIMLSRRNKALVLLLAFGMGLQAQDTKKAALDHIRKLYAAAQPKTPEQREAEGLPDDLPPDETVVTSHYMTPGNGPVKEEMHFYYSCDFPEEGWDAYCQLRFIIRKTSGGAFSNYEEFLFDEGELVFCYLRQTENGKESKQVDETRYYFTKEDGLIHEIIKGGPVMDDVFARRLAKDLKEGFDKLVNSPYEY
ncbi:MAG: hypothetical protein J5671_09035 [Bacteroidaceae bacterium]|nr:hypothetical protein [Bacteroidaceae bacterium]